MPETAAAVLEYVPLESPRLETPARRWSVPARLAFRFLSVYFGMYVLVTQMLGGLVPFVDFPPLGTLGPLRWVVEWTAKNVWGVTTALVVTGSGSGDKTFDWVQVFCLLVLAAIGTVVWSWFARRTVEHDSAHKWYRLFLRFALGSTMLSYGLAKVIPLQMPYPGLNRLLEPFGQFSPMGVLWASIGASRPYEIFTGGVEASAAILLFIPRMTTLGALVSLAATIEIFTLNMTYDVPVKLFSFQLIVMSLFLLAPDARRLLNVVVLNRPADRSPVPALVSTPGAARVLLVLQLVVGAYLVGSNADGSIKAWTEYGGGAPKSPLYGIWNVSYMSIDGVERAPLIIDFDRWRRVVFDVPTAMSFQRMDDTFARFGAKIDMNAKSVSLTKAADAKWGATLSFAQVAPDRMTLGGEMDGKKVQLRLELFPREKLLLVSRGFNWIQEYPFNR